MEKAWKYTKEDLKRLQSLSLDEKIQISKARIVEFSEYFNNKTYVSFSGGKDSTVLLHLVRSLYPDTPAVFVDTGLEYPEVRDFALSTSNVVRLKPEMNFKRVIEKYGYPLISKEVSRDVAVAKRKPHGKTAQKFVRDSDYHKKYGDRYLLEKWKYLIDAPFIVSNQCCNVMKKNTAKKYKKESGRKAIIGTMASESNEREKNWLKYGCNGFEQNDPQSTPIAFWTEQDVLQYIKKYNLPYSSAYGEIVADNKGKLKTTKCDRTGCVYCMYGVQCEKEPNRFQRLKETHPALWRYCMKPAEDGGLGMRHVLEYIGVKCE